MVSASARHPRRRRVETSDFLLMAGRIVETAGQRVADGNVEDLATLVHLRQLVDDAIVDAVRGLRDSGVTWEEIGATTGTTRQAAIQKWLPRL